jgi:hypothetical protein
MLIICIRMLGTFQSFSFESLCLVLQSVHISRLKLLLPFPGPYFGVFLSAIIFSCHLIIPLPDTP